MGSVKGICNSKERRERIHGNFVQKKRLSKMCKKSRQKGMQMGDAIWIKRCANNLCQRRCYETPLPDGVPVNSGKVIRMGHMK
jgi:hypothetical protein